MKSRTLMYALVVGTVSLSSGCHWFHCAFPNVGWRFHHGGCCAPRGPVCGPVCDPCGPACPVPAYRAPVAGPVIPGDPPCPGCADDGGPPPISYQPAGYPPVAYPPIIGQPQPLPGTNGEPNNVLPAPKQMPSKDGMN